MFSRVWLNVKYFILVFLHDYDWEVAKDICGRLELFYSVTKFFSDHKYPTTNMYFTLMCELKITLNE